MTIDSLIEFTTAPGLSIGLGKKKNPLFFRQMAIVSISHEVFFYVKDAPRTGRPVVDNVDKVTELIEIDRHVSSRSIAQELKIDHKRVLSHLRKVGFNKKLDV
ncbi:hypothetical protein TNCV_44521 [Trichonephila clavipes]|nr:hypothetical protein TNCV_44521 [Trichonephila clavipes]